MSWPHHCHKSSSRLIRHFVHHKVQIAGVDLHFCEEAITLARTHTLRQRRCRVQQTYQHSEEQGRLLWTVGRNKKTNQITRQCSAKWTRNVLLEAPSGYLPSDRRLRTASIPPGRQSLFICSWFLPLSRDCEQIVFKVALNVSPSKFAAALSFLPVPWVDLPKFKRRSTTTPACANTLYVNQHFFTENLAQLAKKRQSLLSLGLLLSSQRWSGRRRHAAAIGD